MEDDTCERRPKRQKRESSYKAKAFEKFKQLKSGVRNKYEIEELENVYDTVDEKEYTKTVLSRQDDDWIVDDDGSGYLEDGRDIFDDDLDHESIAAAASTSKGKGIKRKKKGLAENAGKGNLQYLLSNMPAKKKEDDKLEDETLSELLGELDSAPVNTPILKPKRVSSHFSPINAKKAEREYMNSLLSFKKPPETRRNDQKLETVQTNNESLSNGDEIIPKNIQINESPSQENADTTETCTSEPIVEISPPESTLENDCFKDDLDLSQIDLDLETDTKQDVPWENVEDTVMKEPLDFEENPVVDLHNSDLPLIDVDGKKVFRFFWWDAYEDVAKRPGVVLLFGKTYHKTSKSFVSCCVVVKNIERKVFFLPRAIEENSCKPVTTQDVFLEISESVMKEMNIKQFKARPVTKKYAFDPQVPSESEYIEVRYMAKEQALSRKLEGKTFSRVFGTESSFLEILLLDRKIKGPCWLDISNPVPATNPVSLCKLEIDCNRITDVEISKDNSTKPPPLVVSSINLRTVFNTKTGSNEIVMLSCATNVSYAVDKEMPKNPFQSHFCVFTCPSQQMFPMDIYAAMKNYNANNFQKMNSEKAVLNYFINRLEKIDSDLIVGHDLQGYQMNLLSQRLVHHKISNFDKLGRIKRTVVPKNLDKSLFVGRLVCDIKVSAQELMNCRSYDLDTLCQSVLKLKEGQRIDLEQEHIARMYQTSQDVIKLISLTMQDGVYILRIMYNLNIVPLALQITNIAGNVMSKTLMGGRSERNEFLLLHAFSERNYIVPDKNFEKKTNVGSRKGPAYAGGLVLDPKVGLYDKFVLLMDFNSLYPSIIQEYNLCFTTVAPDLSEEKMVLPDSNLPAGILPTEIRKLVESRREVKKLMNNSNLSPDARMQYHIRQMALKLTANSMYGCLGFGNSRFYAKNLAALVTYKGREILTNTKDLVEKMYYEVIYGDTDSLMINTNIVDYDQVFQIGTKIKQEINKLYKQIELDIDGVFKYLLLLKKKKYAAVTVTKDKNGTLRTQMEYKGLDIVRRDCCKIAAEAGKFVLNEILSDQPFDDRVNNIMTHLRKLREDLESGRVPLGLLVITKQLSKNPNQYPENSTLSHVQVALRYNKECGGHLRSGDTVPYIICEDGSSKTAAQRAYHIEEVRNSKRLVVDVKYYLNHQIFAVVERICGPIAELNLAQLAECLGVEASLSKADVVQEDKRNDEPQMKFEDADKFVFKCFSCKFENQVDKPMVNNFPVLAKCQNPKCKVRPVDYVGYIQNQMVMTIRKYIDKYYLYEMYCEDPLCDNETVRMPVAFAGRFPVCPTCKNAVLLKKYTHSNLFMQIAYFHRIFDLDWLDKRPVLENQVAKAYEDIRGTVEKYLKRSAYSVVCLSDIFTALTVTKARVQKGHKKRTIAGGI